MKFAYDIFAFPTVLVALGCLVLVIVFAGTLILSSVARARAEARFGEPTLVAKLFTFDATGRRAAKGVMLVFALMASFAALARPQFGRGTRLIPATNLDVVVVLDYSKSMYARDVAPSRIQRAKAEVARLIQDLPGARFAAVAFAGEPMSFPLTSDGPAIAQFFRQLDPNDMPVGGTATARALERARELLARDPTAKEHVRVIVLVTDGEDLEGDPLEVARKAAAEGTRIDVVQIGGRTPEVIPEIGPDGKQIGLRRDEGGRPLTTELSSEGEEQLARIATETKGEIVRSEHGQTGIDQVARGLSRMMKEELSEKIETVYAEEYAWPLGLAVLLLVAEALLGDAPRRRMRGEGEPPPPPARTRSRKKKGKKRAVKGAGTVAATSALLMAVAACSWDPSKPFEREAPPVREAIQALDAGDSGGAAARLQEYLATGPCSEGTIGAGPLVKKRPDGTFDLGLSLFNVGEAMGGRRFGDEENDAGGAEAHDKPRDEQIDCALRLVRAIAEADDVPLELRARARYLEGNLLFLGRRYEEAVAAYDRALVLTPGFNDAGDPVGRDAAWNRAIALRRIEDKKKDGGSDGGGDGGGEGGSDGGGDSGGGDAGADSGPKPKGGGEDASPPPPNDEPDAGGAPPPPTSNQEDRVLDQLERAPTVQQEAARKAAQGRKVRGMADK